MSSPFDGIEINWVRYSNGFFDEDLDMFDLTFLERDGVIDAQPYDGTDYFLYKLEHIKKQFANYGEGVVMVMHLRHSDDFIFNDERKIRAFIRERYAEHYI